MDEEPFLEWARQLSVLEPGGIDMINGHLVMRSPRDFLVAYEIEHWPSELTYDQALNVLQWLDRGAGK